MYPDRPAPPTTLREIPVLTALAQDLAGEFRLEPLLNKIVTSAVELLGCSSGSICTVDQAAGRYRKEVDLAVVCRAGAEFPLDEGVTGAVIRAGGTVAFADYADVPGGHISMDDPRYHRAVIGVPITLQSVIMGALIVFADDDDRTFGAADAALIELFATHAAIAIANSRLHTHASEHARSAAALAERQRMLSDVHDRVGRVVAEVMLHLQDAIDDSSSGRDPLVPIMKAKEAAAAALEHGRLAGGQLPQQQPPDLERRISRELDWVSGMTRVRTQLLVVGERRPLTGELAQQLLHIVREALTNVVTHARADAVRAGLVYGSDGVTVIVEDDGVGFDPAVLREGEGERPRSWGLRSLTSRARQLGGTLLINSTPAWGTRIEASLPYQPAEGEHSRPSRWRLLVAHDSAVVRAGYVRLLADAEPAIQVVAEVSEAFRALDAAGLLRPDIVLADIDLPADGGRLSPADFAGRLKAAASDSELVFAVPTLDDHRIREAVRAGVRGFVDPRMDGISIARAVVSAASGDAVISGQLLDTLGNLGEQAVDTLTAREREVHELVTQGLPDKQIAASLAISVKTVEKHVGTILRKTGARNRTMLAALARGLEPR